MATYNMTLVQKSTPEGIELYSDKITMTSGTDSDLYLIPQVDILDVGFMVDGSGVVKFTYDTPAVIVAGTASWISASDGATINRAVTGWKVTRTSGTVIGTVTVRAKANTYSG